MHQYVKQMSLKPKCIPASHKYHNKPALVHTITGSRLGMMSYSESVKIKKKTPSNVLLVDFKSSPSPSLSLSLSLTK